MSDTVDGTRIVGRPRVHMPIRCLGIRHSVLGTHHLGSIPVPWHSTTESLSPSENGLSHGEAGTLFRRSVSKMFLSFFFVNIVLISNPFF